MNIFSLNEEILTNELNIQKSIHRSRILAGTLIWPKLITKYLGIDKLREYKDYLSHKQKKRPLVLERNKRKDSCINPFTKGNITFNCNLRFMLRFSCDILG